MMGQYAISILLFLAGLIFARANIVKLSDSQKQECVNAHNEWRIKAGATAMIKMKWNDNLTKLAETFAGKCKFDHSTFNQRSNVAGFFYIGENIYVGWNKPTLKEVVDKWGEEVKDYDLQWNRCNGMCGHYTQIVWSKTSDVGCAMAQCNNVPGFGPGFLIFCNYGPGGNVAGEKPFEKGAPGSKCQQIFHTKKDRDGLCSESDDKNSEDTQKPKPPENPTGTLCEDRFQNCPFWEKHCSQAKWLRHYCPKTCKTCGNHNSK